MGKLTILVGPVNKFAKKGKLKARTDGRSWKFRLEDVMTYKEEQEKSVSFSGY